MAQAFVDNMDKLQESNVLKVTENLHLELNNDNIIYTIIPKIKKAGKTIKTQNIFIWSRWMEEKDTLNKWLEIGKTDFQKLWGQKYAEVRMLTPEGPRVGVYLRDDEAMPFGHKYAIHFSVDTWHKLSSHETIAWVQLQIAKQKNLKKKLIESKSDEREVLREMKSKLPKLKDEVILYTWKWRDISAPQNNRYFFRKEHARYNALLDPEIEENEQDLNIIDETVPPQFRIQDILEYAYSFLLAKQSIKYLEKMKEEHPEENHEITMQIIEKQTVPIPVLYAINKFFFIWQGAEEKDFNETFESIDIAHIKVKILAINLADEMLDGKLETGPRPAVYMFCDEVYKDNEEGNALPPQLPPISKPKRPRSSKNNSVNESAKPSKMAKTKKFVFPTDTPPFSAPTTPEINEAFEDVESGGVSPIGF